MANEIKIYVKKEMGDIDHHNYYLHHSPCPWNTKFADNSSWGQLINAQYCNFHTMSGYGSCNKYVIVQVFENGQEIVCGLFQYVEKFADLYKKGQIIPHKELHWLLGTLRWDDKKPFQALGLNSIDRTGLDAPRIDDHGPPPNYPRVIEATPQMIERRLVQRWFMTLASHIFRDRFMFVDGYEPYIFTESKASPTDSEDFWERNLFTQNEKGIHPPSLLDNYKITFQNTTEYNYCVNSCSFYQKFTSDGDP